MTRGPNADQADFWNAGPGETWVSHQPDLDALHAGATGILLAGCSAKAGERVVDVGCGAGASTLALAAAVGPSGHVLGLDISAPLTRRAEERRRAAGAAHVAFALADAQDHPFPPGAFDLAASRFGLMFFADPVAALRNIGSSLRPGGRIAFVAWSGPRDNPWFTLPLEVAAARLGPVEPTAPDAPGPMAFRDIERVTGLLEEAGFTQCRGARAATELHHPGGVEAVVRLVTRVGPTARILRERGGGAQDHEAMAAGLAAVLGRFRAPDGVRIPAGVNLFTASRA